MKKTTILILLTLICISFVSCTNDNANTNKPNLPSAGTNINTPITEADKPHTTHTGKGSCEVCGIKYYDVLVDYVKTKGTKVEGMNNTWKIITYEGNDQYVIQWNTSEAQGGVTLYFFDGTNYAQIRIQEASVKYGEYSWSGYTIGLGTLSGEFDASTVSPEKDPVWTYSSTCKSEADSTKTYNNIKREFTKLINVYLVNMCKDCGITPQNLGFERFE